MIENISIWTKQIILAVIIASIIELITPSGKNKKYVKMVIGMYILLIILSPIVSKFTGESVSISSFDYEKYFEDYNSKQDYNLSYKLEENNNEIIKNTYITNLKKDIEDKIKEEGFVVSNMNIKIDTSEENYGKVLELSIHLKYKEVVKNNSNISTISINKIEIGNQAIIEDMNNTVSTNDKNKIIDFLSEEYEISKEKIKIE